jgi:hypothetical protein
MESKTRHQRSNATVTPTIRAMDHPGRTNGHRRTKTAAVAVGAFAVKNVAVATPPIDQPARALADGPAPATAEPLPDSALHQARARLAAWDGEIQALIGRIERVRYTRMIGRMQALLRDRVPRGAIVAVVSRGDEQLVTLPGRRGWHFPQAESGVYAGHHPADSDAAIAHLERLRARGARYLVIPRTSFWWLEHYRGFAAHLERVSACLARDERTCALFALNPRRRTR